jgi:hypothetical protein
VAHAPAGTLTPDAALFTLASQSTARRVAFATVTSSGVTGCVDEA